MPRGYVIWFVAAIFVVYQFSLQVSAGVMTTPLKNTFQATDAQISFMVAIFAIAYAVVQIPVGILLDNMSARRLMTGACLICALGAILFGLAPTIYVAGLARLVMGLGASFAFVGTGLLACRWVPPHRFALIVGVTEMMGMLGAAGTNMLVAYLLQFYSWQQVMIGAGVVGVLLSILFGIIVRDFPPAMLAERQKATPATVEAREAKADRATGNLFRSGQIWLVVLYYGLTLGVSFGFSGLWNIPFLRSFGRDLNIASNANALIFLGLAVGSTFAGWFSERVGSRRWPVQAALVGALVFMGLILYTPKLPEPIVWFFMSSFGFFCGINILAFAIAADSTPPEVRGTVMGVVNMAGYMGVTLLEMLPGILLHTDGQHTSYEYDIALTVYPVCLVLALLTTFAMKETLKPGVRPAPAH